jgi:hypothetical protein
LGENALDLLISDREKNTYERYQKALSKPKLWNNVFKSLLKPEAKKGIWQNGKRRKRIFPD